MTAAQTPIKHEKDIKQLAEALMKLRRLAVIKYKRHDKTDSMTTRGNYDTDQAAKKTAGYTTQYMMLQTSKTVHDILNLCDVYILIKKAGQNIPV